MPTAVAVAAVGAAAAGVAASAGGAKAPRARDPYEETSQTLQAQVDLAPDLYEAEAAFRPKYTALDLQVLEQSLLGSPAGTRTETVFQPGKPKLIYLRNPNDKPPPGATYYGQSGSTAIYQLPTSTQTTRQVEMPAMRGLLDLFEQSVSPRIRSMQAEDQRFQRGADIADVAKLGPEALAALKAANPDQAALIDELSRQAQEELALGAQLDPSLQRLVQQSVREGQSARGFGLGPMDIFEEALSTAEFGQSLRDKRRAMAAGVVGLNQSAYGDPFLQILGRPSRAGNDAGAMVNTGLGLGAAAGPRLFNPESAYAADLFNTNYNAKAAANISNANNRAALIGSLIGAGGMVGGGYLRGRG